MWKMLNNIMFFCEPLEVLKGFFLRASYFYGGIHNVIVGCD